MLVTEQDLTVSHADGNIINPSSILSGKGRFAWPIMFVHTLDLWTIP